MITANDVQWDVLDGITYGYVTVGDLDYEIVITERVAYSKWNRPTNERTWAVTDHENEQIGSAQAWGIRNSRKDALAALNAHLSGTPVVQ